jgi:hypothetical protein
MEEKIMVFQPGQSGNPLGRAKHIDPRSEDLQRFCKERRDDIKRVGEIVLEKATKDEEPWALKLCMEYFYPKPGTFVAISKEETKEVNLNFINALPYEDQQTFLKIWLKGKKGIPAFSAADTEVKQGIDATSSIEDTNG